MLRRYQYVRRLFQTLPKERFGKSVITILFGLAIVGVTFGSNVLSTHSVHAEPAHPNIASLERMIDNVFGSDGPAAVHVAMCESSMNPRAVNWTSIGGSHATGLFQILSPSTWRGTPQASQSPLNARANILAAHNIFLRDGHSWREWACRP